MKMILAVVRPEKAENVVDSLAESGFMAFTKLNVVGRGKQRGIRVGGVHYDELPKVMFMLVTEDRDVEKAVQIISLAAFTGNIGDGKIFVSTVDAVYTARTGSKGL